MTIADGQAAQGGGVYITGGTVTLTGDTLSGNRAVGADGAAGTGAAGGDAQGGGVFLAADILHVSQCLLDGNQAQGGAGGAGQSGGGAGGAGGVGAGGGIYVAGGAADVQATTFSANLATGGAGGGGGGAGGVGGTGGDGGSGAGGGVYVMGGTADVQGTTFSANQATGGRGGDSILGRFDAGNGGDGGAGSGAGVAVGGETASIQGSTLSGNQATGGTGGFGGFGSGAFSRGGAGSGAGVTIDGGNVSILNSTLSNNQATGGTGGFRLENYGGTGGDGSGGALNIGAGAGTVALLNSTLAGNQATGGAGAGGNRPGYPGSGAGGGLAVAGTAPQLHDTIIATNAAPSAYGYSGADVNGAVASQGYNLIGDGTGGSGFAASDLVGGAVAPIDPRLGPLAYNGGPTQTMALLFDSPAINAADNSGAPLFDQRGPGFGRISGGAIDIGAFELQAGHAATHLVLSGPAGVTGDTPFTVTVVALDDQGGLDFGFAGLVRFSANDHAAVLPAPYAFTPQDHAVHAFSVTLGSAGSRLLTAYAPQVASGTIGVQVGRLAASFKLAGFVSPVEAGTPGAFTVTAYDASGHVAAGYRGTVFFASDDGQASLPAAYTFTAADAGRRIFTATLYTAGRQTISVTDVSNPDLQGTGHAIQVTSGPLVGLNVVAPAYVTWGTPFEVRVTAVDSYGNAVPGYRGTVSFSSTDPNATLPADYTFTAGDRSTHVFTVTYNTEADTTQTVTASDGTFSASATASVTGPAVTFALDFFTPFYQGIPSALMVHALDVFGNAAAGYRGTVHFTSTDPAAVLPDDYTFTDTDAGRHTFQVTFFTVGNQAVGVYDANDPTVAGGSGPIEVDPSFFLTVAGFPSPVVAGTPGTFTVTVYDAFGNVATGFTSTVIFSSSDHAAELPDDYTFTAADAGVHTFEATLNTPGTQYLGASDLTDPGGQSGRQDGIEVTAPPGAAAGRRVAADAAFALLAPGGRAVASPGSATQPPPVVTRSAGEPGAAWPEAGADRWAGWAPVRPPRPAWSDALAAAFEVLPADDWLAW